MWNTNPFNKNPKYEVLRPCLWFYKGQEVHKSEIEKWFTKEAFDQLVECGYIELSKRMSWTEFRESLHKQKIEFKNPLDKSKLIIE